MYSERAARDKVEKQGTVAKIIIMEWIIINKWWLQYVLLGALILATILQFLFSKADHYQTRKERREIQTTLNSVKDQLEKLSKVEGLERYLQDIKIESLRKYVDKKDLVELQKYLKNFSDNLNTKNLEGLKIAVSKILEIIPTDPFFRVYNLILQNKYMTDNIFSGEWRIVQVVKWDWVVEGDEKASLYVRTANEQGNEITYGPFTNNTISMLDKPLNRYLQIRIESHGTGRFEWYPRSFRIGWAVASKEPDGLWKPNLGLAEFDPYFRIGVQGELEY